MTEKGGISTRKAWGIVLVSLIDDVVIIGVVVGLLWFFHVKLPVWAIVLIVLVLGSYVFVRTWAVIPSIRRKRITGAEGMIGMVGEVVESETERMVVRVHGEYWHAECCEGDIEPGEEVEVVAIERLKLTVQRRQS